MDTRHYNNWKKSRHLNKMSNKVLLKPESFEELAVELQKVENMATFRSRDVLVLFMIIHYPQVVIGNGLFDYYLQNYAAVLFASYTKMCETNKKMYYVHFWHNMDTFTKYFKKWKDQDRYRIMLPLLKEHHSLQLIINSNPDEDLSTFNDSLISKMNSINRRNSKTVSQLIEEYALSPVSMEESIILDFHDKFWRDFYKNIKAGEYQQVSMLLVDCIKMFNKILPNRPDIIEQNIDIEIINQQINNNALSRESMQTYILNIFNLIRRVQSASEDNDTDTVIKLITEMFTKNFAIEQILTFSFSKIFKKLEITISQLNQLNT
jgi:hypothetical protein